MVHVKMLLRCWLPPEVEAMANDPNWDYWNDIKMAWDRLEFVLMGRPAVELTERERGIVEAWQRTADSETEAADKMYAAFPPPGYHPQGKVRP